MRSLNREMLASCKIDIAGPIDFYKEILDELQQELKNQTDVFERIVDKMYKADTIWLNATGRSLESIKYGGMRLAQMGKRVVVTSDNTYTHPPVSDKDVMLAVSGSGKTRKVVEDIRTAKEHDIYVSSIVGNPDSPEAELSDSYLLLKAHSDKYNNSGESPIYKSMGSSFEFKATICGEIIANEVGKRLGYKEKDLRHSPFG